MGWSNACALLVLGIGQVVGAWPGVGVDDDFVLLAAGQFEAAGEVALLRVILTWPESFSVFFLAAFAAAETPPAVGGFVGLCWFEGPGSRGRVLLVHAVTVSGAEASAVVLAEWCDCYTLHLRLSSAC